MQAPKKIIKVSFQGETKRLQLTDSYESLCQQTRAKFGAALDSLAPLKFYYLDEEIELISINSQSDFEEALSIEDMPSLKLTVAASVADARRCLERELADNSSLAESLNRSQFAGGFLTQRSSTMRSAQPRRDSVSDFEDLTQSVAQMETARVPVHRPVQHEMAVGSDSIFAKAKDMGTDVSNLVRKTDMGSATTSVLTRDTNTNTAVRATVASGAQAGVETHEMGCDGIAPAQTISQGNQAFAVAVSEAETSCQILIPDSAESGDEPMEEPLQCFKCKGSQVNKKGLPCRKCNATGVFTAKGLGAVARIVQEEITEYLAAQGNFKKMFDDYIAARRQAQDAQEHANFVCDGCQAAPIRGVRYMCSVCPDFDLCGACEAKGQHKEHALLKIRKPEQAPAKLICQYENRLSSVMTSGKSLDELCKVNAESLKGGKPEQAPRYQARFVKETFGD